MRIIKQRQLETISQKMDTEVPNTYFRKAKGNRQGLQKF